MSKDTIGPADIAEMVENLDQNGARNLIRAKVLLGYRIGINLVTTRENLLDFFRRNPYISLTPKGQSYINNISIN